MKSAFHSFSSSLHILRIFIFRFIRSCLGLCVCWKNRYRVAHSPTPWESFSPRRCEWWKMAMQSCRTQNDESREGETETERERQRQIWSEWKSKNAVTKTSWKNSVQQIEWKKAAADTETLPQNFYKDFWFKLKFHFQTIKFTCVWRKMTRQPQAQRDSKKKMTKIQWKWIAFAFKRVDYSFLWHKIIDFSYSFVVFVFI